MTRNIVICCDGTGNEIEANLSNVLKLYRVLTKNTEQVVFYDPGVGTMSSTDPWSRWKAKVRSVWGLATGWGIDDNVLDAYRFLVEHYRDGDRVYMFGFSRGAYTVRMLAGFLRLVGLLRAEQAHLARYALTAYKRAAEQDDFTIAWRFERVAETRRVPIAFMGLWDTVASMIVPRPDRFFLPSLQRLPYTMSNDRVRVVRHAIAADERRRMFRPYRWTPAQTYKPNPFSPADGEPQDVREVWFAGSHGDIGGGYPETESGAAKFPLRWVIDEAVGQGLLIKRAMYNHLVLGAKRQGGSRTYVAPSTSAPLHNSVRSFWCVLEVLPKRTKYRDWAARPALCGLYLPLAEPRTIPNGDLVHHTVFERRDTDTAYRPPNLPEREAVTIIETELP